MCPMGMTYGDRWRRCCFKVEDWSTFYEKLTGKIIIHNLRPSWLIFSDGFSINRLTRLVKRIIDVLLSIVGLCLALPGMAVIALLIKFDAVGPVRTKLPPEAT
jgi:hypothetical protein